MPTYEYACNSCGEHVEVVQSFRDEPLTACPTCGGPLRKVFGSIGVVFKGSGFYKTDSRSSSKPQKTEKAGDSGEKSAEPAAKSSDSKSTGSSDGASSSTGPETPGKGTAPTKSSPSSAAAAS